MPFLARFLMALFLLSSPCLAQSWEQQITDGINVLRDQANQAELEQHGYIRAIRHPLFVHPTLTYSAQWWCNALEGEDIT